MKQEAELRNYRVIDLGGYKCLSGQIYNDKTQRFDDGATVRTSRLESIDEEAGIAITRNTTYTLVK